MKIVLSLLLLFVVFSIKAQDEDLFPEIKNQLVFPFNTPDELPTVGFMADDALEYAETDEERSRIDELSQLYPDITEKLQNVLGEDSELTIEGVKLNAFGRIKIDNIQYIVAIETGIDADSGYPYESLVMIAFYRGWYFKDELYLKSSYVFQEYDEEGNTLFSSTLTESKLEEKEGTLFITSNENYTKELIGEEETVVLEKSTTVNHYKFLVPDHYFDLFLIEN